MSCPRHVTSRRSRAWVAAAVACVFPIACSSGAGETTAPSIASGATVALTLALPALDTAREGHYEAWVGDAAGRRASLGTFASGGARAFANPLDGATQVEITLEPAHDADPLPSAQRLLAGALRGGELRYEGAVTQGDLSLRAAPGQFTMFSPSDNDTAGYPSHEEAGIWLFNMSPGETAQKDYYVRVTQLQAGWTYEGWMVRDIGEPSAIWLSYGKFVPDWTGALNQPDDTGWGPYSGVLDFRRARLEDFPGDDWISNPLGFPWNPALTLPLNLREKDAAGRVRWTHVITIEPSRDRGEPISAERPFFMRPYADPFGDLGPGVARTVTLHAESMPHGTVEVR